MAFDTLPTTNLTGVEIRNMLQENGGDVDDNFLSFFSEDANLNSTSKYKPVRNTGDFIDGSGRWKAADNNCGFSIPILSNYSSLPSYYNSDGSVGMNGWEYQIPNGKTSAQPMRLGDFRGYCPVVIPFVQGFTCPDTGDRQEGSTLFCQIALGQSTDTHLGLSDIATVANCYFGVYAVMGSSSRIAFGSDNNTVELPCADMGVGKWTIYPFLSNARSHGSGTKYYPIPFCQIRTVNMVSDNRPIKIMIRGYYYPDSSTVTYEVLAMNTGASTTMDGYVYLKYQGNDLSDSVQTGEKSKAWLSVSFRNSSMYMTVLSGSFTGVTNSNFFKNGEFTGLLWYAFGNTYTSSNGTSPMRDPSGQL